MRVRQLTTALILGLALHAQSAGGDDRTPSQTADGSENPPANAPAHLAEIPLPALSAQRPPIPNSPWSPATFQPPPNEPTKPARSVAAADAQAPMGYGAAESSVAEPAVILEVEPGFTLDQTGLDFPFRLGVAGAFANFSGTRVLPAGLQSAFAARFPIVGQAGSVYAQAAIVGLVFKTNNFGRFGLNYRLLGGTTTVAYVTANGPQDVLVQSEILNSRGEDSAPMRIFVVPDAVGSCLVSSRYTLNQLDWTWSPSTWFVTDSWGIFGHVGVRSAVFLFEDYTRSTAVFQQAKSTFYGAGPIAAVGVSRLFHRIQFHGLVEGGDAFGGIQRLDREMVIGNNGTQIRAVGQHAAGNVGMLSAEAGVYFSPGEHSCFGVFYRFDQWWNLGRAGGSTLNWSNHTFGMDFRWRL